MNMRRLPSVILLAVIMAVVAAPTVAADAAMDPKAAEVMKQIDAAEAARKKAASVESEWTTTGKLIKKARAAESKGDYDKALGLAKEARLQGEIAYQQGASQSELRIPAYLKY
ncbi:MAG: SoxXA-binding protein [Gammaproteobacteria bacterium]|nr:SoxXA-binding protein [Gammaproteobacteria bacterium]